MVCGTWADAERGMGVGYGCGEMAQWGGDIPGQQNGEERGEAAGGDWPTRDMCTGVCWGQVWVSSLPFLPTINEKLANDSVLERGDLVFL